MGNFPTRRLGEITVIIGYPGQVHSIFIRALVWQVGCINSVQETAEIILCTTLVRLSMNVSININSQKYLLESFHTNILDGIVKEHKVFSI